MGLLKNKAFIIISVLVVLLIVLVAGYKLFSIYSFNSLSKELETGNTELFSGFKDEIASANKIDLSFFEANTSLGTTNFSKEKNDKYLNQTKTEYDNALSTYKKALDNLESNVSKLDSTSKMPLWLSGDQKKFVSDTTTSLKAYKNARRADYGILVEAKPVFSNVLQLISDTGALFDYMLPLQTAKTDQEAIAAFTQNFSKVASLEKYSKDTYKFEGQDALATKYPDSYKAFAAFKIVFGQYYLAIKGLSQGDMSQTAKLEQIGNGFKSSLNSLQNPLGEISSKKKSSKIEIKDTYADYAKALDFYSEKKLYSNLLSKEKRLVQNNQNKAAVLAYGVDLYQIDLDKYPTDKTFSGLAATLKDRNYLVSDLKYNEADFTYTSDGAAYYKLGYKDEVSGKVETFTVGVTKEAQKALGASIKVVKIKGVELNFSSVNVLTSYINSLTY